MPRFGIAVTEGLVLGFVVTVGFIFMTVALELESGDKAPDSRFKVVDKYEHCDVVRYTPDKSGKFVYLLHCN